MTVRELPPDEWHRLAIPGSELETAWRSLTPGGSVVLVVEDDVGSIVGTWTLTAILHVDGIWVDPAHRGRGAAFRRLLRVMGDRVRELGGTAAWTSALSPTIEGMIGKLGGRALPGTHYVLPFTGGKAR